MNVTHVTTNGRDYLGWNADSGSWQPIEQETYNRFTQGQREEVESGLKSDLWGGLEAISQGLSLGSADETTAALAALPRLMPGGETYGDAYRRILGDRRKLAAEFEARNPNTAMALESLGGAMTGALTGGAAGVARPAQSMLTTLGKSTALGAGEGAFAGLMSSDANDLDAALEGAGFGALVGVAAPAVAAGLGGGAQLAGRIARALTMNPEAKAHRQARELLERMGMDEAQFAVKLRQLGPDAVFADVSETAAQQLRAAAAANPRVMHAAESFFEPRSAGSRGRVLEAAEKGMGVRDDVRLTTEINRLDNIRRAQAQADYREVYAQTPPMSPDLERILKAEPIQKAFEEAKRLRRYNIDAPPLPEIYLRHDGQIEVREYPTVEIWDEIKRGLDLIVENDTTPLGKVKSEGREALRLKHRMLEEIDKQVEGYKAARNRYAGKSALIRATEQGRNVFNDEYEVMAEDLARMTDNEREAFKIGAFNAVRDEIESTRLHGTPAARQKFATEKYLRRLRAAFDDDRSFNRFRQQLERELGMQRTRNIALYGSDTARTLLAAQEQGANMLDPTMATPEGFLAGIGRRVVEEIQDTPRREIASEIYGRGLLQPLEEAVRFVQPPAAMQAVPTFPPGAGVGALIGGAVTGIPEEYQGGILGLPIR